MTTRAAEVPTDWVVVAAALLGGIAAALQIGKASAVLVPLAERFSVGVADTALYLSLFSIGAATLGLAVGVAATRVAPLGAGLLGLGLIGTGSLAGGLADSWTALLAARAVEALGFPLVVATMPALIQAHSTGKHRVLAMGFWATWLPFGIAFALGLSLIGDLVEAWRSYLALCGTIPLAAAALLFLAARRSAPRALPQSTIGWPDRATLAVAVLFGLFSASYLIVQGFLPTIAVDLWNFGPNGASGIGATAALLVILGNLAASVLMTRGVPLLWLYAGAMAGMAVAAAVLVSGALPTGLRLGAALVFTTAAGMPPAVIWTLVPRLSAGVGIGAAIVAGTLYQGAGLGQLAGPVAAGFAIEASGSWTGAFSVIAAVTAVALVLSVATLRRMDLGEG